jgi:hypothetical protein
MGIKIRVEEKFDDGHSELARKLEARRERLRLEKEEEKEEEIDDSLSEIYRDASGRKIDVNRMKIRRKQGLVFWFFNLLVFALVAIVLGMGAYYYIIYGKGTDSTAVDLKIEAPNYVSAGEEFTYMIKYKNDEFVPLKTASLKVDYPQNFIFLEASRRPDNGNGSWNLGQIGPRSSGEITVKGKIIDKAGISGVLLAQLLYTPENFSSEFKKENSASLVVKDIGFTVNIDSPDTVLVGDEESFILNFKPLENNYLPEFLVRMEKDNNIELEGFVVDRGASQKENGFSMKAEKVKDADVDTWLVSGLAKKEESLEIKYKVKSKKTEKQEVKFSLIEEVGGGDNVFYEQTVPLEIMKSDLNLNLILNGSHDSGPVDFGEKMNYSIIYANKGEAAMKDVVIMMVLDSDFIDWTSLDDKSGGRERGNTITWTKTEIPALEKVDINGNGTIDFSVNVLPFKESDLGKDFKITSYAQYAIGGLEKLGEESSSTASSTMPSDADTKSNTIENTINSDLNFKEQVRYFDENNLPVGNGPLPPAVGEKTSFKVYWDITNNLHDLNDVRIETVLLANVEWDEHNRTSVGTISYDSASRKVTWLIGRLPITVFRADAEFNISVTPAETDRNKVIVLLNGSKVFANDAKTGADLEKDSIPKTSKLEDDDIANMSSDGRVK